MSELSLTPKKSMPPLHLSDLSLKDRKQKCEELGLPGFRADQVSRHWYGQLSDDLSTWSDMSAKDREVIADALLPKLLHELKTLDCDDGATRKTVWRLHDNSLVESVLMKYPDRVTMCISSQAGCGMACPFCATGQGGLTRNLSAAEIFEQVRFGAKFMKHEANEGLEGRVSNIVFMGMGEPLANYNRVITAIHRIVKPVPEGLGISARNVTVSTVGLVPRIYDLAKEGMPLRLAISLHAPDDELRDTLVPINLQYKVSEVLDAAWHYAETVKRRVSIEYALIRDINDQAFRAEMLARLLVGKDVHVNLIPLNPTEGSDWTASRRSDEQKFVEILERFNIPVTIRDTRGREIDGACGQLAAKEVNVQ